MKKFISLIILICTLMISSIVSAKQWEFVYTDYSGNKIYIDVDSVLDVKDLMGINYRGYYVQAIFKIEYSVEGRNAILESRRLNGQKITSEMQDLYHRIILCTFKNFGEGEYCNVSDDVSFARNGILIPEMSFVENGKYYNVFNEIMDGKFALSSVQYLKKKYAELVGQGLNVDQAARVAIMMTIEYHHERINYLSDLFFSVGLSNGAINPFGFQCLRMLNFENSDVANIYINSNPISTKNFILTNNYHPILKRFARRIIQEIASSHI